MNDAEKITSDGHWVSLHTGPARPDNQAGEPVFVRHGTPVAISYPVEDVTYTAVLVGRRVDGENTIGLIIRGYDVEVFEP
jgi:hypothetical protein